MASKPIGAAWKKTSGKGVPFMSANIELNGEKINLVIFRNDYKEPGTNQPDFKIFLSEDRRQQAQAPWGKPLQPIAPMTEDDVPF